MAYYWKDEEYGTGNFTQPSVRLRLRNYEGPYDPAELMSARDQLLNHVERTQNMAAWSRIRMKTPVNINGIRDEDDGFGETSDVFSHADLPENKKFEEPYEDHQVPKNEYNVDFKPLKSKSDAMQVPTATVTREDKEDMKVAENDNSDDGHLLSGKKIVCKEIGREELNVSKEMKRTITEEVNIEVSGEYAENVQNSDSAKGKKDLLIDENTEAKLEIVKLTDARSRSQHFKKDAEDNEIASEFDCYNDDGNKKALEEQDAEFDIKDEDEKKVKQKSSVSILKCDHCEVRCNDRKGMSDHLGSAVHYSASEYEVDSGGGVFLIKAGIITNMKAKFKTVVMKCPIKSCQAIFPQMDLCVYHFNEIHWHKGMPVNWYGLVDIVKAEQCCITLQPPCCCKCSKKFKTYCKLKGHMKETHFPTGLIKCKKAFLCHHCVKSFKFFQSLVCHQKVHKGVDKDVFNFQVFLYTNERKLVVSAMDMLCCTDVPQPGQSRKRKHVETLAINEPCKKNTRSVDRIEKQQSLCGTVVNKANRENSGIASVTDESSINNREDKDPLKDPVNDAKSLSPAFRSKVDLPVRHVDELKTLQNTFKCDYCTEINNSKEQMISHLNVNGHKSASIVLIDGDKNIQYMKDLSSISSANPEHQTVYAACSETCPILFDSVKLSIEHYILCHNNDIEVKPHYGLTRVLQEKVLTLSMNTCIICEVTFQKLKSLSAHYKAQHYPFQLKYGHEIFFRCVYCPRTFEQFKHALSHIVYHKKSTRNGMLELSVLYTHPTVKRIELLSKHSSIVNGEQREEEIKNIQLRIRKLEETSRKIIDPIAKKKMKVAIRAVKETLVQIFC